MVEAVEPLKLHPNKFKVFEDFILWWMGIWMQT